MNRRDFLKTFVVMAAGLSTAGRQVLAAAPISASTPRNARRDHMKILVITGSPRQNGNSNTLADNFMRGAQEAGHEVERFDSAFRRVHPCTACNSCGMDGDCVFDDDFTALRPAIIAADMVAFATPMYYFGFSAQLKAVIDRFYAINGKIHVSKKAALMMTYANSAQREADPIRLHYEALLRYLGWTDAGTIIVPGVWPVGAIERTSFPEQAYRMGREL